MGQKEFQRVQVIEDAASTLIQIVRQTPPLPEALLSSLTPPAVI